VDGNDSSSPRCGELNALGFAVFKQKLTPFDVIAFGDVHPRFHKRIIAG
jgi:hypothetical protein